MSEKPIVAFGAPKPGSVHYRFFGPGRRIQLGNRLLLERGLQAAGSVLAKGSLKNEFAEVTLTLHTASAQKRSARAISGHQETPVHFQEFSFFCKYSTNPL